MNKLAELYGPDLFAMAEPLDVYDGLYDQIFKADGLGYNCGDVLTIKIYLKNNRLYFDASGDYCILARASLRSMSNLIQGKDYNEALDICTEMTKDMLTFEEGNRYSSVLSIYQPYLPARRECVRLPWILMSQVLASVASHQVDSKFYDTSNMDATSMDCDACIKISCVLSNNHDNKSNDIQSIVRLSTNDTNQVQKNIQKLIGYNPAKLTKLVLSKKEINCLRLLSKNWDSTYTEYYRKIKSTELIHASLTENNFYVPTDLENLFTYKRKHYELSLSLWEETKQVLYKNNIKFAGIKGISLHDYYCKADKPRFSSDIDILVPDVSYFLQTTSCLLARKVGYELHDKLGLVGSFKIDINHVLTGHAHLIKKHMDKMVTIDLSFPNIPNGRYHLLDLQLDFNENDIVPEIKTVYSVVHAFKHSRLPIKEINDCYLLFHYCANELNSELLQYILKKNNLLLKFALVRQAVFKEYPIEDENEKRLRTISVGLFRILFAKLFVGLGWPYSSFIHQVLRYIFKHTEPKRSEEGKKDHKQGQKAIDVLYSKFGNNRFYCIPILEFKENHLAKEIMQAVDCEFYKLCSHGYILVKDSYYYLLTNIGVFALQDNFVLSDSTMEEWYDLWHGTARRLCSNERYRMRLTFNKENGVWVYE